MTPLPLLAQEAGAPPALPAIAAAQLPHDLSPWGMFLGADIVVKAVMVGLAFASLVTWTVWLAKGLELQAGKRRVRLGLHELRQAPRLAEAHQRLSGATGVGVLVAAALEETRLSHDLPADGVKERTASRLERLTLALGRQMTRGTGVLATIGATAPFVGLFGTVWGIMNSFVGISQAQTTNLAVVAPGIAEALLATALGLAAAIPAVVIYNVFARAIAGYRAALGDAASEVLRTLGRELDARAQSLTQAAE
jgi:biopolymer transport protein ExbB